MTATTILLYLFIGLASLVIYLIRKRFNYWKDQGIAHDEPSIVKGNLQGLLKTRNIIDCLAQPYNNHKGTGPFCGFYFFQTPSVLVLDPKLVKNVLIEDFANFTDRGLFHNEEDDPLTGRLFLLDGDKWKNLRKKLSPSFTPSKMKFTYPTVIKVTKNLVDVLTEITKDDNDMEIKELLARYTTDIIGLCAFGINCNSLQDPHAEFRIIGKRSLSERKHGKLLTGFMQGFPKLARKLHMRMVPNDINEFFMRIVRETVAYREENNIKVNDFLSILIDLKNDTDKGSKLSLSLEEMAAQTFMFFLGGFETSSSTMAFALYELAQHQDVQQRVRDEVNLVFDGEGNVTYEEIQQLQYTGQVISETLRKYPPIPLLNRQALSDYIVPGKSKYIIKKGMLVLIPVYAMHHDPDLYPEPEKFDPERFAAHNVKQRDSVEWLPFGEGPRNCIGILFGLMQTRVGLAYLVRHFRFTICDRTEIPLEWSKKSFLLTSENGIFLKVEKI